MMSDADNAIAFQGHPGAYSHRACLHAYPAMRPVACSTFHDAFEAVQTGMARLAMIPIDNTIAGRVADIHHLLPTSPLHIIAEHFEPIHHHLLGIAGASLKDVTHAHSHIHALNQCRATLRGLRIHPVEHADTAGAAQFIATHGDKTHGAIASSLAAEINDLIILQENIEDADHNTTRFVIMAREADWPAPTLPAERMITSFLFEVRNVPAALYKALGGFATNGVNMIKLESYVSASFQVAEFYAEIEGHPEQHPVKLALEELAFFTHRIHLMGTYRMHPFRYQEDSLPKI